MPAPCAIDWMISRSSSAHAIVLVPQFRRAPFSAPVLNPGSTTLSGYTPYSRQLSGPDLRLVEELVGRTDTPVTAEGRYWTPGEAAEALRRGAHAVVIGTAITNPLEIARRFATALGEALTR